jgi:NADPH2:quinone reductase
MKEALITTGPKVNIVDSDIPKAGKDQIVIKVIFSGSNPKDWKVPGTFDRVRHLSRRPARLT